MAGGSKLAVYAAISANALVTVAKFAGFLLTGSGSMFAEAVHSLADVGNQGLLAVGLKRSAKPADADHPDGYGQAAFIWSLISAVGMFFLGCGVSVMHGIGELTGGHEVEAGAHGADAEHAADASVLFGLDASTLALAILVFAFVIEGASLLIAVRGLWADARRHDVGVFKYLRETDDPFLIAILMEDSAAVLGVVMAFVAIGLGAITGQYFWDPVGSIAIGCLLGLVAVFLIAKNRALLLGKAVKSSEQEALHRLLSEDPAVEHVAYLSAVVQGTESVRISAELDFDGAHLADLWLERHATTSLHLEDADAVRVFLAEYGEAVMDLVAQEVDRIEAQIRTQIPRAEQINLEPE